MEFGQQSCQMCLRRPKAEGGNGSCPQVPFTFLKNWQDSERDLPIECPSFRLGDSLGRRREERKPALPEEGLF